MRSCPWFALDREELQSAKMFFFFGFTLYKKPDTKVDMQILAGRAHRQGEPFLSSVKFK